MTMTKAIKPIPSTLKANKTASEVRSAMKAAQKAYLEQWGPKPNIKGPGLNHVDHIDTVASSGNESKAISNSWVNRVLRKEF